MRKILSCVGLLLAIGLLSSCGLRTDTNRYYYSPTWTRNSQILHIVTTQTVDKDIFGSQLDSDSKDFAQTIYPTGTGESPALFETTGSLPSLLTCSPNSDYVAYADDLISGLYRKIVIRNISLDVHSGVEVLELAFNPGIKSFDWSNDGTRLVYCTSDEIRIISLEGEDTLVLAQDNLVSVSWKYGSRIAFIYASGSDRLLSLVNPDGSGRLDLSADASVNYPQISAVNTSLVYGINQGNLARVDVDAVSPTIQVFGSGFPGDRVRLSPDATTLTYSKAGEKSGIYIMDIASGVETRVR
jgi:dipeptidyl aminopeptidase/acylaminoacyl peptidase